MIPNSLPPVWTAFASALGNHVWQSTLFAVTAGLLTLVLRKNHARARYWLWVAASVKFLIPFALLIGMGSHLAWSRGPAVTKTGLYFAVEEVSQPFTQPVIQVIPQAAPMTVFSILIHLLPVLLAAVWLCGFAVVFCVWYVRWRRILAIAREAAPLREGREVEALRRLERMGGAPKRIEMRLSRTSLEPGIFGIVRPVLVWPQGISERLEDAHLEVILAHELWHVRRRDNLAAAMHMLVEAIFWFHPLVWWMGARLVEERERACDEEVLESGSDRKVYAESILKICEYCVGSPLTCVSGVTGADLKKRIVQIMTEGIARKLDVGRKLLLSVAGFLAVVAPIAFGLLHATQIRAGSQDQSHGVIAPVLEVVSITPNKTGEPMAPFKIIGRPARAILWKDDRFRATNFSLQMLIRWAYDVQDQQISGGPDWLNSENYDVDTKMDKSAVDDLQRLSPDQRTLQRQRMLQKLLADQFRLTLHRETQELPVYELAIAKNGPKFHEAKPGDTYPNGLKRSSDGQPQGPGMWWPEKGKIVGQGVSIASLVRSLSEKLGGRIVVDKTALIGNHDFTLSWSPDGNQDSIFPAIQEQLGLALEPQTRPVEVLVIDHAEQPAEPQARNTAASVLVYETTSIKPNQSDHSMFKMMFEPYGFSARSATLRMLIRTAYGVEENQISGAPNWVNSEYYDIEAKMDSSVADELGKFSDEQRNAERRRMLQLLLADRFKLAIHRETKELGAYSLVVAKNGPKLQEAKPGDTYPNGFKGPDGGSGAGMFRMGMYAGGSGELIGQGLPMATLARLLSERLQSTVLDSTGLTGNYDFTLKWASSVSQAPSPAPLNISQQGAGSTPAPDSPAPSIFAAIQEQLGLKLESQNGSGELLVIDHAERPLEN